MGRCSSSGGTALPRATAGGWARRARSERLTSITWRGWRAPPSAPGRRRSWSPPGSVNDSFAPDAPFMESWTTASALASLTRSIRILVAINPAGCRARPDRAPGGDPRAHRPGADRGQPGGRGRPEGPYGTGTLDHEARYARLTRPRARGARAVRRAVLPRGRQRRGRDAGRRRGRHLPDVGRAARPGRGARRRRPRAYRAPHPLRPAHPHHRPRRATARRPRRPASCCRGPRCADDRADEYAGFDSVGQARMNAIPADDDGWAAPGLWAGIRAVRGGAGTALVGSYARGRVAARRVPRLRYRPGDRVRVPPPRGGRAGGHRRLAAPGRLGPRTHGARPPGRSGRHGDPRRHPARRPDGRRSWRSGSAPRCTCSTGREWRPRRGRSRPSRGRTRRSPTRSSRTP